MYAQVGLGPPLSEQFQNRFRLFLAKKLPKPIRPPLKVIKKSQPHNVYDGHTGQLVDSAIIPDPPSDIPEIVEAYTELIGKVIGKLAVKEKEAGLESRDINSLVALGRTIAMFQATEEMRISRVGGKAVKELTSKKMRELLAASDSPSSGPEEGELE